MPRSCMTQGRGQRPAFKYCKKGWKNKRMYSGFKLTNTGYVWKNKSMVWRFPLLEISLRKIDGVAVRSSYGIYDTLTTFHSLAGMDHLQ